MHCCFLAHSSRLGSHHLPSWDGGSSCAGLAVNLLYFLFFLKKKTTIFALSKSPTYDYSARGLGTSEHYQHAVGGTVLPYKHIIIGLKEHRISRDKQSGPW